MATVTAGKTFVSGETVTPAKLNSLGLPTVAIADDEVTTSKILNAAVTADKLATGAVTGAAGGGKLTASVITGQTLLADPLASGDEFMVHDTSASALRRVAYSDVVPAGTLVQAVQASVSAHTTSTSVISRNNTAPTSSSGTEILSQAITPASASNKVLVRFNAPVSSNVGYATAVVLRGTTVIQVVSAYTAGDTAQVLSCEILDSPASASAQTYSVRLGLSAAGTVAINGTSAAALYGGTSKSTLTLQEIKG